MSRFIPLLCLLAVCAAAAAVVLLLRARRPRGAQGHETKGGTQDAVKEMEELVRREVRQGFASFDEIIERVADQVEDEGVGVSRKAIGQATTAAFTRQRAEEATWPFPTDCDRLDLAFHALEQEGIVGRQNFACCLNCGIAEIRDEIEAAKKQGQPVGYVFYHMQDTEHAAEDGNLHLAYGSVEEGDKAAKAIGGRVVEALRREGLDVEWDGDSKNRILVRGLQWRRRRFPQQRPRDAEEDRHGS